MPSQFRHFPRQPRSPECQSAYTILCNAHDTASSFLEIFEQVRQGRRGAATDEHQDLLRAMLVFASSGLDSMVKQLIRDALRKVIERQPGAQARFKTFIEKRIVRDEQLDKKLFADVVGDVNPRGRLLDLLVLDLTGESMQSIDQVLSAGSYFDVPSAELISQPHRLRPVFHARNQIAHEMDVDFTLPNRSRRPRARATMVNYTNEIFEVAEKFLSNVDSRTQ